LTNRYRAGRVARRVGACSTRDRQRRWPNLARNDLSFLALCLEAETAPPTDWLITGARVTRCVESATIAQSRDEDGSAGADWAQIITERMAQDIVLATARVYQDPGDGTRPSALMAPLIRLPGSGEHWLAPESLPEAERMAHDDLTIARRDKTVEGPTYHVVRFNYASVDARYTWQCDQATGLLVR
jgi:hypothetical protein